MNVTDRYAQFALLSVNEAIKDSQIQISPKLSSKTAVIHGTGISGQSSMDEKFKPLYADNNTRCHLFTVTKTMNKSAACLIRMEHGIKGPSISTASACSPAAHAITNAYMFIRSGLEDVSITGVRKRLFHPAQFGDGKRCG